jgi:prephenate dehydrogenase
VSQEPHPRCIEGPIAIVGLGLIGTSIALAVRRALPDATLIGVDSLEVVRHARISETFTSTSTELDVVSTAELVVLATPVQAIIDILPRLNAIAPHARTTDVGSTKRAVITAARNAGLPNFVGGHPMAGSDRTGPDAAHADLFDTRPWFLVGSAAAVTEVGAFVHTLGGTPVFMSDDGSEHDRMMAAVSHLPQVVVSALMARVGETVGRDGLVYAGSGLRDTTRLAASEASVWQSILSTNADALQPLLMQLAADLQAIAGDLEDPAAVRRLFGMANMFRRSLIGQTS